MISKTESFYYDIQTIVSYLTTRATSVPNDLRDLHFQLKFLATYDLSMQIR